MASDGAPVASLRRTALRGIAFTATRGVLATGLRIVTIAILARILTPADFGLVAAVVALQELAVMIVHRGISDAIVQRADLSAADAGTAMTLLLTAGLGLGAVLWFLAPSIESWLALPGAEPVLRAVVIVIPIEAAARFYHAMARRNLKFERVAVVELVAAVVGGTGVAIAMALLGFGYWALIGGIVATSAVHLIGFALPSWRHYRPTFSVRSVRHLFGFGAMVTLIDVVAYGFVNIDRLILARVMGADAVGYFSRARNFITMFGAFYQAPVNQVLFPTLARIQNEPPRLVAAYRNAAAVSALLGLPGAVVVATLAESLVAILFGAQWTEMVPLVQTLALCIFFVVMVTPTGALLRSIGQNKEVLWMVTGQFVLMVAGTLLLYPLGLAAVAACATGLYALGFIIHNLILARKLNVSPWSVFMPLRAGLIYSVVLLLIYAAIEFFAGLSVNTLAGFAIYAAVGGAAFLVLFFVFPKWFLRDELLWVHAIALTAVRRVSVGTLAAGRNVPPKRP